MKMIGKKRSESLRNIPRCAFVEGREEGIPYIEKVTMDKREHV
jgi:hypothetical protein